MGIFGLYLKSFGDPVQSGGVLFHIVKLGNLRSRVSKQIRHLPGRQSPYRPVRLLLPIDEVRGEGMPQAGHPNFRVLTDFRIRPLRNFLADLQYKEELISG